MRKFIKKRFSSRLKHARLDRRLTQEQLARKIKIPATSISHFESAKDKRKPSLENIMLLAQALPVSTDYLLGIED